jgi:hypothetical protein
MGVSGQRHAPAALYPRERTPVPTVQEAGWASEPVLIQRLEEKSFAPVGDRTPIARSSSPYSDTILTELPRLLPSVVTQNVRKGSKSLHIILHKGQGLQTAMSIVCVRSIKTNDGHNQLRCPLDEY